MARPYSVFLLKGLAVLNGIDTTAWHAISLAKDGRETEFL